MTRALAGASAAGPRGFRAFWELTRPFTHLLPAVGLLSGAVVSLLAFADNSGRGLAGLLADRAFTDRLVANLLWALVSAIALNAFSNVLNQIFDQEIDRVNKPGRPLASGRVSPAVAGWLLPPLLLLSLASALAVGTLFLLLVAAAALLTVAYSVPPVRTKRRAWPAQVTIALPRGLLLKLCGWLCVEGAVLDWEAWYLGLVYFLFLLGASATKDLADVEGDRLADCRTLPVAYGQRRSAWIIAPFLVLPWILLPLGALPLFGLGPVLSAGPWPLGLLALGLGLYGAAVARQMIALPQDGGLSRNHPAWTHMYLMTMASQVGLVAAYLVSGRS